MTLAALIDRYVAYKRSLGMRFDTPAKVLKTFCRAIGPVDADHIDQPTVQAFLNRSRHISAGWHLKYRTLDQLFRFAIQRALVAASPMPYRIPKRPAYATPYIYSPEELRRLLEATAALDVPHPKTGQRAGIPAGTFRTLLLLLYGAGLRLAEALSLTIHDVDLSAQCLVVRNTKFFKTRLLPIGPKLAAILARYADSRVALVGRPTTTPVFFLGRRGHAIARQQAERYFRIIRDRIGLERRDGAYFQPRLHDLRHTFAVHRLVVWYRSGADVQRLLPQLSTYLGHLGLAETQHYLSMTPELLREASQRFERYATPEVRHEQ
jgi:site-specific recombinase XerD